MTVVRFPSRLRVSVVAGENPDQHLALALAAYDAALGRSTDRALQLQLVRTATPEREPRIAITFCGDTLPAAAAESLRTGLTDIVLRRAASLTGRSARLPGHEPAEPQQDRWDGSRRVSAAEQVDDAYLVPGYNGGGAPVAVPVTGGTAPQPGQAQGGHAGHAGHGLWTFTDRAGAQDKLREHYHGTVPAVLVAVFLDHGTPVGVLLTTQDGEILRTHWLGRWLMFRPDAHGHASHRSLQLQGDADLLVLAMPGDTPEQRLAARTEQQLMATRHLIGPGVAEADLLVAARRVACTVPDRGASRFFRVMAGGTELTMIEVSDPALPESCPVAVLQAAASPSAAATEQRREVPLPLGELMFFEPDPSRPFLGEPVVEWWQPAVETRLLQLMARVAQPLGLPVGHYPGMLVLAATARIADVAAGLGARVGTTDGDNPRTVEIRRLAGVLEPIEDLCRYYAALIGHADAVLQPPLWHNEAGWLLHFFEDYTPRVNNAVRVLFTAACQDILLGVLESSHRQLQARSDNFDAYLRVTRVLLQLMVVDDVELMALRELLVHETRPTVTDFVLSTNPATAWWGASRLVVAAMRPAVDPATDGPPQRGRVRRTPDGARVQDSAGRWWSRTELDSVIAHGRREALLIDPMLDKIASMPEAVDRLRLAGPDGLDAEFRSLIRELLATNEAKTRDARRDPDIAFGLAQVAEAPVLHAADSGGQLSGVHAQADALLRPCCSGSGADVYALGLRELVGSELGREAFLQFFNLVGLVALAIVCPPAAFAIGAVEAVIALDTAIEHTQLQRSMLGGDDIITHAQAEAELWAAAIGAALAILPEAGTIGKAAVRGGRAVLQGEVRESVSLAGQAVLRNAATHIAQNAARDLTAVFVRDCLTGYLVNLAIGGAIGRLTQAVAHEIEVTGQAAPADLPRLIADAVTGVGPL